MSAMHHDTSSDLNVVGKKLEEILGVNFFACLIILSSHQSTLRNPEDLIKMSWL